MQEEIENKTINLAISTSKLTVQTLFKAVMAYLRGRSNPRGKQSIKKLVGQNKGVTNIDIEKTAIRGFGRYAKKYGIDTKDPAMREAAEVAAAAAPTPVSRSRYPPAASAASAMPASR